MLKALYSILLVLLLLLTFIRCVDSVQKPLIATRGCKPNRVSDVAAYGGIHRYACSVRGGEVLVADTPNDLDAILMNSYGALVVIDFGATWCGPCKMIAPLFKELSEEYSDSNVVFVKIDVDENVESAAKYGVSAMPTFVFLKDGEVVDRLMGANPTKLQEMIEELK